MNKKELFNLVAGSILVFSMIVAFFLVTDAISQATARESFYQLDLYADHGHPELTHRVFLPTISRQHPSAQDFLN